MGAVSDNLQAEAASQKNRSRVRLRAILLGLILSILICLITPFNNVYRQATPLGGGHFPLAPFYILLFMTLLMALYRKIFRGSGGFTAKELLVTWILMVIASGISYTGLARTFFINLTAPFHFAAVENRWGEILHPLLPGSWYPQNTDVIESLYNGLIGGRQMGWGQILAAIPWKVWIPPLMVWGGFVFLCYFVMLCIINLLSGQALYHERMNFPLLRVPQLMENAYEQNDLHTFFLNKFILAGMFVPVFLHLLNGLSFYYPDVPQIPTLILAGKYFPKYGLFSGFYKLKIYIYPAFIGFAFLTAKQVSFSFWFFFVAGELLIGLFNVLGYNIPAAALGVTFGPVISRPEETQMIGAYVVFFIFLLWLARFHLLNIVRYGISFKKGKLSDGDWISTRSAFWGFVLGGIGIVWWLHHFGIPLFFSFLVVFAYFMMSLVAVRVVCQGGLAYFTLSAAPIDGLMIFFGPRVFTHVGLLVSAVAQKILFLDLRESLMPSLLHAARVTERSANMRMIFGGICATVVASVVVSFVAMLALCYKFGIRELGFDWATSTTISMYQNIQTLIESPVAPGKWALIFTGLGAGVMLALAICYHRFFWWPIHPIGYLTAYSSAMRILWFSFLVGWFCNALCMRYGGVVLYRRLRYFFVGLIIGDFLMGGSWAIVGLFTYASYQVLPT